MVERSIQVYNIVERKTLKKKKIHGRQNKDKTTWFWVDKSLLTMQLPTATCKAPDMQHMFRRGRVLRGAIIFFFLTKDDLVRNLELAYNHSIFVYFKHYLFSLSTCLHMNYVLVCVLTSLYECIII